MGLQDLLSCSEDSVNSERSGSSNGLHDLLSYSVDSVKFENTQRTVKNISWAKKLWGLARRNSSPQAYRQVFFAKRCTFLVKYGLHSPVYGLQTHIGGRHPVLYYYIYNIHGVQRYSAVILSHSGHFLHRKGGRG